MPTVNLAPRLRLYYQDDNPDGSPTVVLLHGLGANSDSWQLQIPVLTQAGFRVLAPDAPGFGQSSYPGSACIAQMAENIVGLFEVLQVSCFHLVGISMGGTLALQIALDYPQLVGKLVLVNTFAHLKVSDPRLWPYLALRFVLVHTLGIEAQAKAVAQRIFPHSDQVELRRLLIEQVVQSDPSGYRATMRALARFNVTDRLAQIQSPTLVVTGECDTTVPPETQHSLVRNIPAARQVSIAGAGHAVSVEKPEQFNKALLDFLLE